MPSIKKVLEKPVSVLLKEPLLWVAVGVIAIPIFGSGLLKKARRNLVFGNEVNTAQSTNLDSPISEHNLSPRVAMAPEGSGTTSGSETSSGSGTTSPRELASRIPKTNGSGNKAGSASKPTSVANRNSEPDSEPGSLDFLFGESEPAETPDPEPAKTSPNTKFSVKEDDFELPTLDGEPGALSKKFVNSDNQATDEDRDSDAPKQENWLFPDDDEPSVSPPLSPAPAASHSKNNLLTQPQPLPSSFDNHIPPQPPHPSLEQLNPLPDENFVTSEGFHPLPEFSSRHITQSPIIHSPAIHSTVIHSPVIHAPATHIHGATTGGCSSCAATHIQGAATSSCRSCAASHIHGATTGGCAADSYAGADWWSQACAEPLTNYPASHHITLDAVVYSAIKNSPCVKRMNLQPQLATAANCKTPGLILRYRHPFLRRLFGRCDERRIFLKRCLGRQAAVSQSSPELQQFTVDVVGRYWNLYESRALLAQKFQLYQRAESLAVAVSKQPDSLEKKRALLQLRNAGASWQSEIVKAQTGVENAQAALLALTHGANAPDATSQELIPVDVPSQFGAQLGLDQVTATALRQRPEIQIAMARAQQAAGVQQQQRLTAQQRHELETTMGLVKQDARTAWQRVNTLATGLQTNHQALAQATAIAERVQESKFEPKRQPLNDYVEHALRSYQRLNSVEQSLLQNQTQLSVAMVELDRATGQLIQASEASEPKDDQVRQVSYEE